ncbi:MAG: HAMP domain-containing protein, partial [Gemmatimonadales bacterium]
MSDRLDAQLARERHATRRQYILTNTRARWGLVGLGIVLLVAARAAGLAPIATWLIVGFAVSAGAVNYGVRRLALRLPPSDPAARPWYVPLDFAVECLMISAMLYAMGPFGHVLYAAYLLTPTRAALSLGRREAWIALGINVTGFGLVTALQRAPWPQYAQEVLVLLLVCGVLVPVLASVVDRLRRARGVLAEIERGDLTRQVEDATPDELGHLTISVNRT